MPCCSSARRRGSAELSAERISPQAGSVPRAFDLPRRPARCLPGARAVKEQLSFARVYDLRSTGPQPAVATLSIEGVRKAYIPDRLQSIAFSSSHIHSLFYTQQPTHLTSLQTCLTLDDRTSPTRYARSRLPPPHPLAHRFADTTALSLIPLSFHTAGLFGS